MRRIFFWRTFESSHHVRPSPSYSHTHLSLLLCLTPPHPPASPLPLSLAAPCPGKFGFVEMRTIAEANNALSMAGVEFMGRAIRVGRPADYAPPTPDMIRQCEGTGILGTPGGSNWRGGGVRAGDGD